MKLENLLEFDDIVIQCHDNPDADTLASGYALYCYLKTQGKEPRLIYGGREVIRKSNLVLFVNDMQIPIHYVQELEAPELLVMVDCQYEGGNVQVFPAKNIAVIDHHRVCTNLPGLSEINSNLGACSTLVWKMLQDAGYEIEKDKKLLTALRYGLYTDTNFYAEVTHPMDKDLLDETNIDNTLMTKYRNANLSLEELEIAGAALLRSDYIDEYRAAIVKSAPCNPKILGIISDLVLEVDAVDICIVFNVLQNAVKLSVRSCVKQVKANELAAELCAGIGGGGGHYQKAGGTIQLKLIAKEYLDFCAKRNFLPRMELDETGKEERPSASGIKAVLEYRLREYLANTTIMYKEEYTIEPGQMSEYVRKPLPHNYVRAIDLFKAGTAIKIRTVNGDEETIVQEDSMLMIGEKGEVRCCTKAELEMQYRLYPEWNTYLQSAEYTPSIRNDATGVKVSPESYARICVPKEEYVFQAMQLKQKVKLFADRFSEHYRLGRVGDYLVNYSEQAKELEILAREDFETIGQRANQQTKQKKKAVIFDLDGTLLDTLEDLMDAVNVALASENYPPCTLEQIRQYVGNGVKNLMIRAVPKGEENPGFERILAVFKNHYKEHCLDKTKPYKDVLFLLKELKEQGVPMAIVSNKPDSEVKTLNKRFFGDYVQVALGETEGLERKPAKDLVVKAQKELGMDFEDAIYVGDSEVDLQTARNAGLSCISVTWGFRDKPFLEERGADRFINNPAELLYHI